MGPALQPSDLGAEEAGAPEPVGHPPPQHDDEGGGDQIPGHGGNTGQGRGQPRGDSRRDSPPELDYRDHGHQEGHQQFVCLCLEKVL